MSAWWTVFRKEWLNALRDRRMVLVSFVVMPLAVPLILAGMSAIGARKQVEKLESTLELPVAGGSQLQKPLAAVLALDRAGAPLLDQVEVHPRRLRLDHEALRRLVAVVEVPVQLVVDGSE